ncbi:hypothetical protein RJ639_032165 [Escallonia herrerae]|uniref:SRR1-like domain-containing protein n=1 Tax=Escallonia herrerae TaxID=1293975 RepID=A0AA88WY53_9ASTE|nr:hypothetical protein RJ639_032165 [Escallonia herrerae]
MVLRFLKQVPDINDGIPFSTAGSSIDTHPPAPLNELEFRLLKSNELLNAYSYNQASTTFQALPWNHTQADTVAKMGQEVSEDQTKLVDDLHVKDEAERLLKEVQLTIKEAQETKFYAKLTRQMRNSVIFKRNLERVLGGNSQLQMVIYALGSMEFSFYSQYQLAIALRLRQDFAEWIGGIEVFDPRLFPRRHYCTKGVRYKSWDLDLFFCTDEGKVRPRDRLQLLEVLHLVECLKEIKVFYAFEVDSDESDQRDD